MRFQNEYERQPKSNPNVVPSRVLLGIWSTMCRVISLMMVTQYFDTLRDLGAHGKANTLFIPHQPGAIGEITEQLRNGFLQAAQTQEMSRGA